MPPSIKSDGSALPSGSKQPHIITNEITYDSQWDDFAIALKTGSEVALQRVPIQLVTFLADVKNKIIIGDSPNIRVGMLEVIDVYTYLYDDSSRINKSKSSKLTPQDMQVYKLI
jgi:hypothetical protein